MAGPYEEQFQVGSQVRVASRAALEQFRDAWRFHHQLVDERLDGADLEAAVQEIGFHHGGDALYRVAGIPGLWHESNLIAISAPAT